MPITHAKVSGKSDGGDATLVRPSDWNADHVGAFIGQPIIVRPMGIGNTNSSTNGTAQIARACPIVIPGLMHVRSLWMDVSASAAGTVNWGVFDYSSNAASCTSLVEGSGTSGGTGWREIAATSAPVTVNPGAYMLIVMLPASTPPTLNTVALANSPSHWFKSFATYTWTSTPDLTSGSWSSSTLYFSVLLEGDMTSGATRW
jgi:hypothetical protein